MMAQPTQRNGSAPGPATLVLGLGVTGSALVRHLAARGEVARVADTRAEPPGLAALPDGFDFVPGALSVGLLDGVERLLVSPGLADDAGVIATARRRGIEVASDIDLFVAAAATPLLTVTGSNGKSTVVSMTAAMLTAAGVPASAAGNIGTPVLDLLDEPLPGAYVVELSSFQLDRSAAVPARAAALLNISADHLDWHGSLGAYRRAKLRILERADVAVVPHELADAVPPGPARVIRFGLDAPAGGDFGVVREDGRDWFSDGSRRLLAVDNAFSAAPHNQLNALAALALVDAFGADTAAAAQALTSFEPLPHRGARVRVLDGVSYVDDSKATNVGAALASIRAVPGPVVLIAGGDAKGADLTPLAAALTGRVRAVVALGRAAAALAAALSGTAPVERAADMNDAVVRARRHARGGDTVLLAPACASTDMFADYRARGEAFVRCVAELGA